MRVVRLTACNHERCVFVTIFPDEKYGSVDYNRYHLIKLIKKNRLERFNRVKEKNTRRYATGITYQLVRRLVLPLSTIHISKYTFSSVRVVQKGKYKIVTRVFLKNIHEHNACIRHRPT